MSRTCVICESGLTFFWIPACAGMTYIAYLPLRLNKYGVEWEIVPLGGNETASGRSVNS